MKKGVPTRSFFAQIRVMRNLGATHFYGDEHGAVVGVKRTKDKPELLVGLATEDGGYRCDNTGHVTGEVLDANAGTLPAGRPSGDPA